MANTKKSTKSTKSSSSSSKRSSVWSLNKVSMYTLVAIALLYVVTMILSCVGLSSQIIVALQGVAMAVAVVIVSILAWRYVRPKQAVWKVLYVLCLLLVLVCIVIPVVVIK